MLGWKYFLGIHVKSFTAAKSEWQAQNLQAEEASGCIRQIQRSEMSHSGTIVSGSGTGITSGSRSAHTARQTRRERDRDDGLLDMLLTYSAIKVCRLWEGVNGHSGRSICSTTKRKVLAMRVCTEKHVHTVYSCTTPPAHRLFTMHII